MKINNPELFFDGNQIKIRSRIESKEGTSYLWYSVDKKYAEYVTTERLDAFLVALLVYAMKMNEDIHIDGPLSEKLFYNLTKYYINILLKTKNPWIF